MAILHVPEANRKERAWFNHLQVIAEGAPSVGWVEIVSEHPDSYISIRSIERDIGTKTRASYRSNEGVCGILWK